MTGRAIRIEDNKICLGDKIFKDLPLEEITKVEDKLGDREKASERG